jgi:hypothetical protein
MAEITNPNSKQINWQRRRRRGRGRRRRRRKKKLHNLINTVVVTDFHGSPRPKR